tara:strand:+ start:527 stop:1021 length:495 start_codon:yes stop_codon:yes gene_type:complete
MAIIKPTLTLVSNASDYSVTAEQGPLSFSLDLSTTVNITTVGVESGTMTVNTADNATGWLFDGSLAEDVDGGVAGTDGSFVYMKNMTATGVAGDIYVGVTADATETVQAMEGAESANRMFTLKPQEFAFFPYDHTMNIMLDTSTDGTKLEWWRFDRTAATDATP